MQYHKYFRVNNSSAEALTLKLLKTHPIFY